MSYTGIAKMHGDGQLWGRLVACAATEGISSPGQWVNSHLWELVAQPGWAEAYEYAVASGTADPGLSDSVVTDAMILSGTQAIINSPVSATTDLTQPTGETTELPR